MELTELLNDPSAEAKGVLAVGGFGIGLALGAILHPIRKYFFKLNRVRK